MNYSLENLKKKFGEKEKKKTRKKKKNPPGKKKAHQGWAWDWFGIFKVQGNSP